MATYTIVSSSTDPLGPGEIAAGSPTLVSEGDMFIIDASADAKITFVSDGSIPANFDVVINDSNVNSFEISVLSDLTPTITVADNVDASGINLGAKDADAVNFTAGDNVQFAGYVGSLTGADTISIGNGFTTTATWSTSGGDDSIIVGDNATFVDIDGGSGNDTITLGDGVTTAKIKGGTGDDAITIGKAATVSSVDGEDGNDALTTETGGLTVSDVETYDYIPITFTPPDHEFAAASGSNVNWHSDWSYFDHPPNSTANLTITSNAGDANPGLFAIGETYDITWTGHDGGNMDDAIIIRSDYLGPGQGAIVFEGINSNTGELFQMVWTPGFDLESWYWDNGGGPSSPNAFWTSDQDAQEFQYECYAEGTLIETPGGSQPIEALQIGDLVQTLDNGPKAICWLRQDIQPLNAVKKDKKPVLIAANALGSGRPKRDLIVSPQHRILVGGTGQLQGRFESEAFAPAKSLTKLKGVRHMKGKRKVVWCHLAFDQHEVITANGCLSESLLLGPMVVNGLTASERQAVTDIFGSASTPDAALNGPVARDCLKVGEARRQLSKSLERKGQAVAKEVGKWDVDLATERLVAGRLRETGESEQARRSSAA